MRRAPVFIFAAVMAVWGLASIPDGGGADRTLSAHQRAELASAPDKALPTPMPKATTSARRRASPESCGGASGSHECLRVSLGDRSWP